MELFRRRKHHVLLTFKPLHIKRVTKKLFRWECKCGEIGPWKDRREDAASLGAKHQEGIKDE